MMTAFWNWFTKITAWPFQRVIFRTKYRFVDRKAQGRHIKGPAVIVPNHTSIFDFATLLFAFPTRTLRVQMAEVVFRKPVLGTFLRMLGGIYVNRDAHSVRCLTQSEGILRRGGVVGVFPEGRLPRPEEERPLPFQPGAALLSLTTGAPAIPVFIRGHYFGKGRIEILIGKPIDLRAACDGIDDEREAIRHATAILREEIIKLGEMIEHEA